MSDEHAHDADFGRARTKALFHAIMNRLAGRERRLLSFREVSDKLHIGGSLYRGVQPVPVKNIIGSVDRYRDFDVAFLPTQEHTAWRWKSINRAFYEEVDLPPVKLYQVGDTYFVLDGNHRVSVARERGIEFIDAEVIECRPRVLVKTDLNASELEILGEYTDFLERTQLDQLRPEQNITFTIAGGYQALLEHIAVHRYYMGLDQQRDIPEAEAVMHWYDAVYAPAVQLIRQQNIMADFPARTESDLYMWVMDHLYYLRETAGEQVDVAQAAHEFVEEYSEQPVRKLARTVERALDSLGVAIAPAEPTLPAPKNSESPDQALVESGPQ